MGRFMSPDWSAKAEPVPYARLGDPQTLNLYAYLRNNPLAGIDADGHCAGGGWCDIHGNPYQTDSEKEAAMKAAQQQGNSATPVQVGEQWLTGTGPRNQTFHDGDPFTEQLRHHENVQDVIKGVRDGSLPLEGDRNYNLGGVKGVGLYLKDYSTLLTGGTTGNLAVTYLGSYSLHYTTSDGVITFTAKNTSSLGSATHLPIFGYTAAGQSVSRFMNGLTRSGPMSPTTQTFIFHEHVGP